MVGEMKGVTLVELLIVLAIIGIVAALATIDVPWLMRQSRLNENRDRLLADIEDVKLKSIAGLPHAIYVVGTTSYKVVRVNDTDNDFRYDKDTETTTDIDNSTVNLRENYLIKWNNCPANCSPLDGCQLWFDRKGVPRNCNFALWAGTFILWYDETSGNNDWTDGSINKESDCSEPCRLIIISNSGSVQYEKR